MKSESEPRDLLDVKILFHTHSLFNKKSFPSLCQTLFALVINLIPLSRNCSGMDGNHFRLEKMSF